MEDTTFAEAAPTTEMEAPTSDRSFIPEGFADKKYLSEVKDTSGVFEKLDWAMGKLGQRPYDIPQDTASPEEWDSFYQTMGRPEDSSGYEFSELPEELKEAAMDEGMRGEIQSLMHKAGVSHRQWQNIEKGWNEIMAKTTSEQAKLQAQQAAEADEVFTQEVTKLFGDKKEQAIAGARELIEQFTPDSMKPHLEELSSPQLAILTSVLDGVRKEYISEDQIQNNTTTIPGEAPTEGSFKNKGQALMASPAYKDWNHPDHEKTVEAVKKFYGTD